MSDQQQRATVSFRELALSNMLTLNALVELLDERGIVAKLAESPRFRDEMSKRVSAFKAEDFPPRRH